MKNFDYKVTSFCGAEYVQKGGDILHPKPHAHDRYELYFLHSGKRDVFIDNEMFSVTDNCLAIIPPLCYHKTEGGAYARTNIHFNKIILDKNQLTFLDALTKDKVVVINDRHLSTIRLLLNEACEVKNSNASVDLKNERIAQLIRTILLFLSMQTNHPVLPASTGKKTLRERKNTTSEMLRVAQYINSHYMEKITLDDICKQFLISKTALNLKFRDVMQTTVVDYLLSVRLKRAVYLLNNSRRSIEEISQACGFSSANYFGLIFKKKLGRSPSSYHKIHGRKRHGRRAKKQTTSKT